MRVRPSELYKDKGGWWYLIDLMTVNEGVKEENAKRPNRRTPRD